MNQKEGRKKGEERLKRERSEVLKRTWLSGEYADNSGKEGRIEMKEMLRKSRGEAGGAGKKTKGGKDRNERKDRLRWERVRSARRE